MKIMRQVDPVESTTTFTVVVEHKDFIKHSTPEAIADELYIQFVKQLVDEGYFLQLIGTARNL